MKLRKRHVIVSLIVLLPIALVAAIAGGACWVYRKFTDPGPMDPPKVTFPSDRGGPAIAYSPDGRYLAATNSEGITIWDRATQQTWRTLPAQNYARSIAYSPDGTLLASPALQGRVIVWDVEKAVPRLTLQCDLEPQDRGKWDVGVRAVCFPPDSRTLIAGVVYHPPENNPEARAQTGIWSWDVVTGKTALRSWEAVSERRDLEFATVACSPDGQLIATVNGYHVCLWDAVTGKRQASPPEHWDQMNRHRVGSVLFTPRGDSIIYGGDTFNEPDVALAWEFATKKERRIAGPISQNGAWGWVRCLALSPDGRTLASAEYAKASARSGRRIRLFDVATGEPLRTFWHDRDLYTLTFSPDGREIAAGCGEEFKKDGQKGAVCIWDVPPR
jgi:WD40 repeat protein